MYVITTHDTKTAEVLEARNMRGVISDVEKIVEHNETYRKIMAEKAVGRPGHYYGRDAVIEGSMPIVHFLLVAEEYGGDQDWWKDDKKFQAYMKRNPAYSWINGG